MLERHRPWRDGGRTRPPRGAAASPPAANGRRGRRNYHPVSCSCRSRTDSHTSFKRSSVGVEEARDVMGLLRIGRGAGCDPACRWRSAASSPATRTAWGSCTREVFGPGRSAGWVALRLCPAHDVGGQTQVAGASGQARTAAARTSGCPARAASISSSSTRNPRILTWLSVRPRHSSVPSGRQRARSPVR